MGERTAKGGLWWIGLDADEFRAQRRVEEERMRREDLPESVRRFFEEQDEQAIWEMRLRQAMAEDARVKDE